MHEIVDVDIHVPLGGGRQCEVHSVERIGER
jgi:hypothetical protein